MGIASNSGQTPAMWTGWALARAQALGTGSLKTLKTHGQYRSSLRGRRSPWARSLNLRTELEPRDDGRVDAGDQAVVEDLGLLFEELFVGIDVRLSCVIVEDLVDHLDLVDVGRGPT